MATVRNPLRRRPKVAFVLAGGGNLGAIQVGQLRALVERGIKADVVVGCSAGAMNGVGYAIDPGFGGVERLEGLWRRFVSEPNTMLPGSWLPSPVQLVRKGTSLSTGDNVRAVMAEVLGDVSTFEELAVAFECVATDIDANAETWFTTGPLLEPIIASAALPSVFPIVEIGQRRYMDGGVLNNVPIERAVELGAREIYVLHMGLHGKPSHQIRRPVDAAMMAYWIARNGRFARDLANLPKGVDAHVIPPGQRPDLKFNDFSNSVELIEQGYTNAVAYLDEQERHGEETSAARTERLRSETRRVVDELRGRFAARRDESRSAVAGGAPEDEYAVIDEHDQVVSGGDGVPGTAEPGGPNPAPNTP